MNKPTVGRIVLYRFRENIDPMPAIITRVFSETCVNLEVFGTEDRELRFHTSVLEGVGERSWSWPPRAE